MLTAPAAPASWRITDGTVPLVDVQRSAGLPRHAISYAQENGLITVLSKGGRGNARRVDVQTGISILVAAALAAAVGAAFVTVYRTLSESGARLTPQNEVIIPLNLPIAA